MNDEADYTIGAAVLCSDGEHGYYLKRVVIDPVAKVLRYLVVEPHQFEGLGRLVPIEQVASATGDIRLSCTIAELEALPFAEETRFIPAAQEDLGYRPNELYQLPYYSLQLGGGVVPSEPAGETVMYHRIPEGEVEVRRGDHVHATDGAIGRVRGLVIDPADHHITHVLLDEGHLFGHKEVAIPITAVTSVDDEGAYVNLTKDQVRDLPRVGIHHH